MDKKEVIDVIENIRENVNICCAATMEPEDVLDLCDRLQSNLHVEKSYVVQYRGGGKDDYFNIIIFTTNSKDKAKKYVEKFNSILKRWKDHYSQYEDEIELGYRWIKDKYFNKYFNRWYEINNIDKCYFEEIELR